MKNEEWGMWKYVLDFTYCCGVRLSNPALLLIQECVKVSHAAKCEEAEYREDSRKYHTKDCADDPFRATYYCGNDQSDRAKTHAKNGT